MPARRTFALAGLGIVAALLAPASPASACDPNRFPYCMTPCRAAVHHYDELRASSSLELPAVPHTGLAGCP